MFNLNTHLKRAERYVASVTKQTSQEEKVVVVLVEEGNHGAFRIKLNASTPILSPTMTTIEMARGIYIYAGTISLYKLRWGELCALSEGLA